MANPTRIVKFSDLVSKSGKPEVVVLWQKPDENSEFVLARKDNRVLTLIQPAVGTAKDHGIVGFHSKPNASFLVFPKPLVHAEGTKVVGVKYELLDEKIERTVPDKQKPKGEKERERRPKPQKFIPILVPAPDEFEVTIRSTTTLDTVEKVKAQTLNEAKEKALTENPPPDLSKAPVKRRVVRARKT